MKKTSEKSEVKRQKTKESMVLLITYLVFLACISGCQGLKDAREIKAAPMPPKYYATKETEVAPPDGSLWHNTASYYEDRKAKRVNDLLTILITETTTAENTASTSDSATSSANYAVNDIFGAKKDFGLQTWPIIKKLYAPGTQFTPTASGNSTSSYAGKGDTSRKGTVTAIITAKVIEVFPNSNMAVESRKEVIVNNEKQIVVLRGIVRPDDITTNNTVLSQNVADAQIYLVGDGVLADKQSQGWLVRFLDSVWPF